MIYDNFTSRHAMRRSLIWVSSSIAIVLSIAVTANLISLSPGLGNLNTNVMNADADTAAEVNLTASIPKQSTTLSYSSQAEIFRFTLSSEGPFTLRYITLAVEGQGLKPVTGWTVYPIVGKQADFTDPIGTVEKHADGLLRLRFYSSASSALVLEPGKHDFELVGSVLKDPTSTAAPELSIRFASDLSPEWDWAWLPGRVSFAWMNVEEALGETALTQVSEDLVIKR